MDPSSSTTSTVVTFNVPVNGCDAGHRFSYDNAYTALLELQSYPHHVRTLSLGPIPNAKCGAVQYALSSFTQPLSALDELTVTVFYPNGPPSPEDVPTLEISAELVPTLHTLRLDGIRMDWESGIFPQLTHVELRNCPGSGIAQLEEFIGVLPTWSALTELHLVHFLSNITYSMSDMDSDEESYYMRPENLRTLVVEGNVAQIPLILYHLDVSSPGATVRIAGHWRFRASDDERSPFEAMVPLDDNFPVIFTSATNVDLAVIETGARLVGVSNVGTLTLEVPDLDLSTPHTCAYAFRKAFTSLISIFATRRAPVQYLTLTGDLSEVTTCEWEAMFQYVCPQLRDLTVNNTGTGRGTGHLLSALTQRFHMNQNQLVCPQLETVAFSTRMEASWCMLQTAQSVLQNRSQLYMPLRNLYVLLLAESEETNCYTPQVVSSHIDALKKWVSDDVRVQVLPFQFSLETAMVVPEHVHYA